jgi:hypothetical protein
MERIVDLMRDMVRREYDSDLSVIYIEGGDFDAYQKAIQCTREQPEAATRTIIVWTCLPDVELLRYPFLDVEFNLRTGASKLGVTGDPPTVQDLLERLHALPNERKSE